MAKKIQSTTNYRLFTRSAENRPTDLKKHKRLIESMRKYGFLKCFPVVVRRGPNGALVVKDGQHRLVVAEMLGLAVHYVEEETDFDVAEINCTAKTWRLQDFAQKHMANGLKPYQTGLEFAAEHGLPIGTAFSLLAGTTNFSNIQAAFIDGTYAVKDRPWADAVANVYGPFVVINPSLKTARFVEACMAVCRVKAFNRKRLLENAQRCRGKIVGYATRDEYLNMLEQIYNYGRKDLLGLKAEAVMAMRNRNPRDKGRGKGDAEAA